MIHVVVQQKPTQHCKAIILQIKKKKERHGHSGWHSRRVNELTIWNNMDWPHYFINFFKIFFMWTIFKVFIEFVTILLWFYVLVFWLQVMRDLSSPTRDWTHTPGTGRWSRNHWTTREVHGVTSYFKVEQRKPSAFDKRLWLLYRSIHVQSAELIFAGRSREDGHPWGVDSAQRRREWTLKGQSCSVYWSGSW